MDGTLFRTRTIPVSPRPLQYINYSSIFSSSPPLLRVLLLLLLADSGRVSLLGQITAPPSAGYSRVSFSSIYGCSNILLTRLS